MLHHLIFILMGERIILTNNIERKQNYILLIDDDSDILNLFCDCLQAVGYNILFLIILVKR